MRRALIGILTLAAVGTVAAPVSATPPSKSELTQLLAGFEQAPAAADYRAWGPETLAILVELYDDPEAPAFVRLRAVAAAGHFSTASARSFLLRVARARGQNDLLVREAVRSLGRAFGAASVADLRPFLAHPAPAVREGAVRALAELRTPRAREALRARLPLEASAHITERIRATLRANRP